MRLLFFLDTANSLGVSSTNVNVFPIPWQFILKSCNFYHFRSLILGGKGVHGRDEENFPFNHQSVVREGGHGKFDLRLPSIEDFSVIILVSVSQESQENLEHKDFVKEMEKQLEAIRRSSCIEFPFDLLFWDPKSLISNERSLLQVRPINSSSNDVNERNILFDEMDDSLTVICGFAEEVMDLNYKEKVVEKILNRKIEKLTLFSISLENMTSNGTFHFGQDISSKDINGSIGFSNCFVKMIDGQRKEISIYGRSDVECVEIKSVIHSSSLKSSFSLVNYFRDSDLLIHLKDFPEFEGICICIFTIKDKPNPSKYVIFPRGHGSIDVVGRELILDCDIQSLIDGQKRDEIAKGSLSCPLEASDILSNNITYYASFKKYQRSSKFDTSSNSNLLEKWAKRRETEWIPQNATLLQEPKEITLDQLLTEYFKELYQGQWIGNGNGSSFGNSIGNSIVNSNNTKIELLEILFLILRMGKEQTVWIEFYEMLKSFETLNEKYQGNTVKASHAAEEEYLLTSAKNEIQTDVTRHREYQLYTLVFFCFFCLGIPSREEVETFLMQSIIPNVSDALKIHFAINDSTWFQAQLEQTVAICNGAGQKTKTVFAKDETFMLNEIKQKFAIGEETFSLFLSPMRRDHQPNNRKFNQWSLQGRGGNKLKSSNSFLGGKSSTNGERRMGRHASILRRLSSKCADYDGGDKDPSIAATVTSLTEKFTTTGKDQDPIDVRQQRRQMTVLKKRKSLVPSKSENIEIFSVFKPILCKSPTSLNTKSSTSSKPFSLIVEDTPVKKEKIKRVGFMTRKISSKFSISDGHGDGIEIDKENDSFQDSSHSRDINNNVIITETPIADRTNIDYLKKDGEYSDALAASRKRLFGNYFQE